MLENVLNHTLFFVVFNFKKIQNWEPNQTQDCIVYFIYLFFVEK